MSELATCCVTGRIAGDGDACGDCDPCIMGASSVPQEVKALLKERDEWREKFAEAEAERSAFLQMLGEAHEKLDQYLSAKDDPAEVQRCIVDAFNILHRGLSLPTPTTQGTGT